MFKYDDKVTVIVHKINRKLKISIKYMYNIELNYTNIIIKLLLMLFETINWH